MKYLKLLMTILIIFSINCYSQSSKKEIINYKIDYKWPVKLLDRKPIRYYNKEFNEDIYFRLIPRDESSYDTPIFYKYLFLDNCIINRGITFYECSFTDRFTFQNSEINHIFLLTRSVFYSVTTLRNLNIQIKTSLNSNIFNDTIYFDSCNIKQPVDFSDSQFLKAISFNNNSIAQSFHFRKSTFYNSIFKSNDFKGFVDYSHSYFNGITNFSQSKFDKQLNFYDCKFDEKLLFHYCSFNGIVHFNNSTLPDYLDLRYVEHIENELDFTYCKVDSNSNKCKIALYGSGIDKIKINLRLFDLWFPPPHNSFENISSVYEKLLIKFKNEGLISDYQELDAMYSQFKVNNKTGLNYILSYFGDRFNNYWWYYSYIPERIFLITIIFLLIFSLISSVYLKPLIIDTYSIKFISDAVENNNLSSLKRFYYGLIYTSIIFFGFKLNVDELKPVQKKTFYIFTVYIVGLICMLFIARIIIK